MKNLAKESTLKVLFLLNLLCHKVLSKKEIIEEFKKNDVEIKKTTINNYINKLKSNNIPIAIAQIKNVNYYSLDKKYIINPSNEELDASSDVKKLLFNEKKQQIIKNTMRVFYKFALNTDNSKTREELVDFGYYSKINWLLVKKLEQHCKNKDIILIDYILPEQEHKSLEFHADTVKIGDWSNRLYLSGILKDDNKISQLPIDKIFKIKKVIKENVRINLKTQLLTYKISKEMIEKTGLDKKESLSEIKQGIATIRRPVDDTFFTIQRLLYFCPDLYYISNKRIKTLIKEKLYALKDIYNDEYEN